MKTCNVIFSLCFMIPQVKNMYFNMKTKYMNMKLIS